MALFFGLMLSVLGVTAFYVASSEITHAGRKYEMAKALYLAEGGLERAITELQNGIGDGWDNEVAGLDGVAGTDDDGILSFGPRVDCYVHGEYGGSDIDAGNGGDYVGLRNSYLGHYDVSIGKGRRSGESVEGCNRLVIRSDGVSSKNFKRRVEAEVELWELHLPECLVYIDGVNMNTKFDGNSFLLDGKDTNPDGSPGPGPDVPAILVSQWYDVTPIKNEVMHNQCDQVLGVGNMDGSNPCSPSVTDLGNWNPNTFNPNTFRSKDLPRLETMVNVLIPGGTYAGQRTIGDADNYLITKCTGDLHITGQLYGYGILIVEGDLVVTGEGRWDGLIIVKNHAWMSGGGNGFHLFGTLLIMNESGPDSENEWCISGQSDGFYSTATVSRVNESVRGLVVNRWRQIAGR